MRMLTFAKRCAKEILRDPLNLAFGLGFPVVLLLLLSVIQSIDPKAFVSQSKVLGVFGEGFDRIKVKMKKHKEGKPLSKNA